VGVRGFKILQQLPDIPRYIYARWMLLSGSGRIFMSDSREDVDTVIQHPANGLTCVIGMPDPEVLHEAIDALDIPALLLAVPENSAYIEKLFPDWNASTARMHILPPNVNLDISPDIRVSFLDKEDLSEMDHLSGELQSELLTASIHSPIAAVFDNELPVSFCYAAAETETLWDISIDTLEPYRRRGFARQAVAFMIKYMHKKGKQPVYGAEETNIESTRLAQKMGFEPIDTLILFSSDT